jgi:hypothetical protein
MRELKQRLNQEALLQVKVKEAPEPRQNREETRQSYLKFLSDTREKIKLNGIKSTDNTKSTIQ